ncbi:hypothetical protein H6F76_28025 [Leptolyngbya sp. FACHB-321]|nr:hypothetical protein [Leptolyngbya sp. FACHB-321]
MTKLRNYKECRSIALGKQVVKRRLILDISRSSLQQEAIAPQLSDRRNQDKSFYSNTISPLILHIHIKERSPLFSGAIAQHVCSQIDEPQGESSK